MSDREFICFLIGLTEYQQAEQRGVLRRDSLQQEGFLHACAADQLARVANKHYRTVDQLQVMKVAAARVEAEIKWEPATGGLYPHVYGELNMDSVESVTSYSID